MIEILIGVNVVDEAGYATYRERMTPLLHAHGGDFRLDVQVALVVRAPENPRFNRLFTIRFPSQERLTAFFEHPEYLAIRRQHFEPHVSATLQFAKYEVTP